MKTNAEYPDNYISWIRDGEIRAEHVTSEVASALRELGGTEEQSSTGLVWVIRFADWVSLGRLLGDLRDMGFLFEDEPGGWPPAAVFDELREKGLVHGEFQSVAWARPGVWRVRTK